MSQNIMKMIVDEWGIADKIKWRKVILMPNN